MQTKHTLPTGYLIVDRYEKGQLETLSIGDYGKSANVKADFLGYTRPLNGVQNVPCMPLSEKWVVTLSTQYGCQMGCTFCDVPKIKWNGNVSKEDLYLQLSRALAAFPNVSYTERLNIHFARMGDPIFNNAVFDFVLDLYEYKRSYQGALGLRAEVIHPVLTTSCPKMFKQLRRNLNRWVDLKNQLYHGQAGLQLSINSTNENQRKEMFAGNSLELEGIAEICRDFADPLSRKYCLNFAYSTDFEIDAVKLANLFDPNKFMVKITPIHNNNACRENSIKTVDGYSSFAPYSGVERDLINAGFDVLVFVPSMDEEHGLVTCGNAILGGSKFGESITGKAINIVGVNT